MSRRTSLWKGLSQIWTAPATLPPISVWAEENRYLTFPAQERGWFRLSRTPYFRPLLDMMADDDIEKVVICKSAQIGGTEVCLSVLGYYAHLEPCPILYVMADEQTAKYVLKDRIVPMFTASEKMRWLIKQGETFAEEIRLANGTVISVAWASSVAKLASRPIRVVILDEVDKPGYSRSSSEGDAISLAIQRTETFFGRKILITSTPTTMAGNVYNELIHCDVIYDWYAKCPLCGAYQPLVWAHDNTFWFTDGIAPNGVRLGGVVWDGGRTATKKQIDEAKYKCGECGGLWDTAMKNKAVADGVMLPRWKPDGRTRSIGFVVNRLYSSLGNSGDIPKLVEDFITATRSGSQKKMQAFVNNTLGEPFRFAKSERDISAIIKLKDERKQGEVPPDVYKLVAGIDVQDFGFYYVIRGFGAGRSYLVKFGFASDWGQLDNIIFHSEYSGKRVSLAVIDSGGHRTHDVYKYCRDRKNAVIPIKGHQDLPYPFKVSRIDRFPDGTILPGGLSLYHIDTTYMKDAIDSAIKEKRFILNSEVTEEYIDQITAEQRGEDGKWRIIGRSQNHYWDAEVYAFAGAVILGIEHYLPDITTYTKQEDPSPQPRRGIIRKIVKSAWFR